MAIPRRIRPGELNIRVRIDGYTVVKDVFNHETLTASEIDTVWAKRMYRKEVEKEMQGRETVVTDVSYIVRYNSQFTDERATLTDLDTSTEYDIESIRKIDEYGRNMYMIVNCVNRA